MRTSALVLVATAALAGCGGSSKKASPQPPAANTGFLGLVAVGGVHKLYMPSPISPTTNNAQLVAVDAATGHGKNGVLKYLDLGAFGSASAVGTSGTDVVAVDTVNPAVYFLDGATDALKGTTPLPAEAIRFPSSDRQAYSLGAAVDSTRRRAWVSVSYGLLEYDLDTRQLAATYRVPSSENFAYDPVARRLYSPYYPCDPVANPPESCVTSAPPGGAALANGLSAIDVASGVAYSLENPSAADPDAPIGQEVDGVSLDTGLGIAAVAVEKPPSIQVLDLATPTFDATGHRWRAPAFAVPVPGPFYTVMAADAVTHLALVAQEFDAGVLFVDLAKAKAGTASILQVTMPNVPTGDPWKGRGEPHGAAIGIIDGKPYAFLVFDDRTWIARIDLRGVASLMAAGSGDFAGLVSYISVPPPP